MNSVKFIGMDVHKNSITIAIAEEGREIQRQIYGTIQRSGCTGQILSKNGLHASELHLSTKPVPAVTASTAT